MTNPNRPRTLSELAEAFEQTAKEHAAQEASAGKHTTSRVIWEASKLAWQQAAAILRDEAKKWGGGGQPDKGDSE